MTTLADWLAAIDWKDGVSDLFFQVLGIVGGALFSWFVLLHRARRELGRLRSGDSDDVLFQAHYLAPVPGDPEAVVVFFRNVAPPLTLNQLYDNPAAREVARKLAEGTTMASPVLRTEGRIGFEILNDAFGHLAGHLAASPFDRETWLFVMTCEDRQMVRKQCVRCFLIRPADLERFADWNWCRTKVRCEQPWHWFRIVALHQIAAEWKREDEAARAKPPNPMALPLVNDQDGHRRIRSMSVGLYPREIPVGGAVTVPWEKHAAELAKAGMKLPVS
jgi:hypothetical protein